MTSSPPDISTLSLSSQQRLHDTYDYDGSSQPRPQYHYNTSTGIPQSPYNNIPSLAPSPLKNKSAIRAGLPSQWLDNNSPDSRSLSPHNNSDFSSAGGSPPMGHLSAPPPMSAVAPAQNSEDEIIPTAIVIKNIPFNVKRETLLGIIESLSIPTPYAFNYHLDQAGSFRGLAFANFRQAADADAVVVALNGFDVQGRKLRVEYKKVLQAGEKERIEREKAIRRMRSMQLEKEQQAQQQNNLNQLYEDYGTALNSAFSPPRTFSSGYSSQNQSQYSPPSMPTPQYGLGISSAPAVPSAPQPPTTPASEKASNELDMNDPSTLEIYSRILLFKDDHMRDELAFSRTLSPKQRRVVHLVAQKLGVFHYSVGEGDERYAVVTRIDPQKQQQSAQRVPHTLTRTPSAYLTPTAQVSSAAQSLRVKKSMPDMKTLHSQAPRLHARASNGNIREGYATIALPSRRTSTGFTSLFGNNGSPFAGSSIPPVPSLPTSIGSPSLVVNGGQETVSNVVRQPRGPGVGGFQRRESRTIITEPNTQTRGVLDATTYEPLEV
ncbi:RNA-binding post-transcriptional regulator cip2 [Leucoagaricus sp. SymC.cos]|nr:RNA-binding post-transcriptional regulator cip2 [Leucoagaricus sp. SymC.cos]